MPDQVPTVMICDPFKDGDFRIINESDFDPKAHKFWEPAPMSKRAAKPAVDQVVIPGDWRSMKYFALRALASNFTTDKVDGREHAVSIIEAELVKRG